MVNNKQFIYEYFLNIYHKIEIETHMKFDFWLSMKLDELDSHCVQVSYILLLLDAAGILFRKIGNNSINFDLNE